MKQVTYNENQINNVLQLLNTIETKGIDNARTLITIVEILQHGQITETEEE